MKALKKCLTLNKINKKMLKLKEKLMLKEE